MALLPAAAAVVAGGMYLNAKYNIMSDLNNLRTGLLIKKHIENFAKEHGDDDWSFYHTLHQTYGTNEAEEAFVFEGRSWTYKELRAEIGRLALELQRRGVGNRTVVGMFVNNSPEFMFSWFALQKVGAIPAPVNTAIAGEAIRHCLRISEAQYFLVGHELYDTASKALYLDKPGHEGFASLNLPLLNNVFLYDYGTYPASSASASHHNVVILHHTSLPSSPNMDDYPRSSRPKLSPLDTQQYLFTSGTTGLPKAAIWPLAYCHAGNAKGKHPDMWAMPPGKRRRWYICLPMFHGTASFAALPGTFSNSGTVVLARRFSRSTFWEDVRNTRCNAILYIGEMLRYLVQAPVDPRFPDEKAMHDVDLALGLGLAPTIWSGFRERFGVAWICEFYSASEATVSLVNSNRNARGVGKVAHWGPVWRWLQDSFYIIKTDEDGEPIRDPTTGFCIKCKAGEVGESISRIAPPLQRRHDYVGENSEKANSTKTLRDVFAKGDEFSRLGDAMMIDNEGFISFQDRLGDTYRAKGHNISTTEVENVLMHHPLIESTNVYAIAMNTYGYEGQLGCAAITAVAGKEEELLQGLEMWMKAHESALPAYAVPKFVRVLDASGGAGERDERDTSDTEGTAHVSVIMKKLKTQLRREGFTVPSGGRDRVYWLQQDGKGYVRLTEEAAEELRGGKARL